MSCRQLSPQLAVAFLLLVLFSAPRLASAATTVQGISIATDRVDYVNVTGFNRVVATATVTFSGNGGLDWIRFDWFNPGGPVPFRTRYTAPTTVGPTTASAADAWVATAEGIGFTVIATINITVGGGPQTSSPPATFNVYNRSRFVVVTDLTVTTPPVHENGTAATARADMHYVGNASYLMGVRFDWYYPDWTLASRSTDPAPVPVSNQSARASATWTIDRTGKGFHVNATYLGGGSVTNTTAFDVLERRYRTVLPRGDLTGRVILDALSSPWLVCFNNSVAAGAQLIIEPGVVLRFCLGTGLFVNGTLTVDALPAQKVYFLSYVALGAPMQAGDWRGITFFAAAPPNASLLSNAVVQAVTDGITVRGTAVTIVNSTIALATGSAILLQNSPSLIGNSQIGQADIGIRVERSSGTVVQSNRIRGARLGLLVEDSAVALAANDISLSVNAGLQAARSRVTVDSGTFRDNGDVGVFLSAVPGAYMMGIAVSGGNDSLRGENSRGVVVELSTLSGARYRSVIFINVTATFINTTFAALQYDLVLVASPTTLVNSTYARLYPLLNSVLTIKNFLHVLVESNLASPSRIAGAWVNVSADGLAVSTRRTNAAGWTQWILLTDRVMDPSRTHVVASVVDVRYDGYTVDSSPRAVNMSASHTERFIVILLISNPGGFSLGVDAIVLLLFAVVMGTVLLAMPAMRRRRNGFAPIRARASINGVVLEAGTSYLLPDEKPDRAFLLFANQVAKGAQGLVISRIYPDMARRRYALPDVPVLWLSRGYGKQNVNPTNLGLLVHEIERFVSGKEDSIVLLDGLEYLLVQNDPQKVVKFIQTLADSTSIHRAKLLVPFDVKSVAEPLRALITRDLQPL